MKTSEQINPNYAPIYCAAMYPDLCSAFQKHGYALAVHGSLARDFDLIAIPWVENPSTPDDVIKAISNTFTKVIGESEKKPHGRIAYTLSVGFGECACDLSFMPSTVDIKGYI
ncbi:MAG: hypothetical protein M0R32_11110 [Candidatus Cloacimonetes bacterium]|jgi:dissimilatory sulfite reductase (desulfoviridin) alpha/beta subunit|nr:hypothetical protein [Candidatus Cloacimonadota bacterium]